VFSVDVAEMGLSMVMQAAKRKQKTINRVNTLPILIQHHFEILGNKSVLVKLS
jgi:hypothetical protein